MLRRIRDEHGGGLTLVAFKKLVREQFLMLMLDEANAVSAIPAMLARDSGNAARAGQELRRVIEAVGLKSERGKQRLVEIEAMFTRTGEPPSSAAGSMNAPPSAHRSDRRSRRAGNSRKKVA